MSPEPTRERPLSFPLYRWRGAGLLLLCGLQACASGQGPATVITGAAAVAASQGAGAPPVWTEAMEARRAGLAEALAEAGVEVLRGADNTLQLRWPADRAFEAGSDQPSPAAAWVWDQVAAALRGGPVWQARILGHGDGGPQADHSAALAAQRALRVRDELVRRGLPAAAMDVEAWGARAPLVAGDTDEARARNRRIELLLRG